MFVFPVYRKNLSYFFQYFNKIVVYNVTHDVSGSTLEQVLSEWD